MTWHLILAILASFLLPLLFLTHLRGMVTYKYGDILIQFDTYGGIVRPAAIQAQQPRNLSVVPRHSTALRFWAPVHQQELHPNPPPPLPHRRPASRCFSRNFQGWGSKCVTDWNQGKFGWPMMAPSPKLNYSRRFSVANFVHCNTMQHSHFAMSWFSTPCTHLWSNTIPA